MDCSGSLSADQSMRSLGEKMPSIRLIEIHRRMMSGMYLIC